MNSEQVRVLIAVVCYAINRNSINHVVYAANANKKLAAKFSGNYSSTQFQINSNKAEKLTVKKNAGSSVMVVNHNSYGEIAHIVVKSDKAVEAKDVRNSKNYSYVQVSATQVELDSDKFLVS